MGENGVGKTTLFRCLMGICQPMAGDIRFFGTPLNKWNRRLLYQRVAFVLSSPESFPWQMTVERLLRQVSHFYPTWDQGLVEQLSDEFQLTLTKKLRHLSSGEHAKVRLLK